MKIRKLISLVLFVVMIFFATPMNFTYAEDTTTPEVYVDSVSVPQGSTVTVNVGIRNAVSLGAIDVSVFYNPDVLTVVSADSGYFVSGSTVSINKQNAGTVKESIVSIDGLNGDGDLMSITFDVSEDASLGDYELTIGIGEAYDTSFADLTVKKTNGKITVTKKQDIHKEISFYSYMDPSGDVSEGDEVHFRVFAYDSNGIAGGTFNFEYDSDVLQYVDASLGSELVSNTALYDINSTNAGLVKITYGEIEAITTQYGAEFFDITFKIKKNTVTNTTVTFSGTSLLDADLNSMTTNGTSASVNIVKKKSQLYVDWDGTSAENRQFVMDVYLTEGSDVAAGDFWIDYDTKNLSCEEVITDDSVGESGAILITKEDTSSGRISFSYVNANGCKKDSTLLHITFKQLHGIIGDTEFMTGGKDVVDTSQNDLYLNYPSKTLTMPYDEGHVLVEIEAKDATCTEDGNIAYWICDECGKIYSDAEGSTEITEKETVIKAFGHSEEIMPAVEPTCDEDGLTEGRKCSICGEVFVAQEVIPALGHDWSEWEVVTKPDCTNAGTEKRLCSKCGKEETREIAALGHTEEILPGSEATCTEPGLTEGKKCSVCGETLVPQEVIPALGHDWSEWEIITKPDCTSAGLEKRTCGRCGKEETREIAPLGHTEEILPAVDPTCTVTGLTEGKKCSVCGEILVAQEVVAALDHNWSEWEVVAAPDCINAGSEKRTCSRCNEEEIREIEALGHDWGDWTVVKEPTEDEDGLEERTCKRNPSHKEERIIPSLQHTHDMMKTTAKDATCTEDGNIEYWTCSKCHNLYRDAEGNNQLTEEETIVKAFGHTEEILPAVEATCTENGMTEGKKCSVCGETLVAQEVIPAFGHTEEILPAAEPTCTENGATEGKKCTACGEILVAQETIPALGHDWGEWIITKKATITAKGQKERTCARCGEIETQEIAKLPDPVKQMGTDGTAFGTGASIQAAEKAMSKMKSDADPAGTVYGKLQLKSKKQTKMSVTISWKRVTGAKKYVIYGNKCGTTNKIKKQVTTTRASYVFTKVKNNKLVKVKVRKGTYYKFLVIALNAKGNVISTSKIIHVATKGGKVGNDKKVTTKAKYNKVTLKVGKTFKLAAKAVPASTKLKVKRHRGIKYESSNKKIATVTAKGVIKGKKKGICYIYCYAQNGVLAKVKVTVK